MHILSDYRPWLLALLLSSATYRATAQDLPLAIDPTAVGLTQVLVSMNRSYAERAGIKDSPTKRPATAARPTTRLTYASTPALRQKTLNGLVQNLQSRNPQQAKAVQTSFAAGKPQYYQLYTEALKDSGFQDNDAASALAAYLETGYVIANNLADTRNVTPAMERGLRAQAAGLLGDRLRSSAAVAQFGEEMKLQTVLLLAGWQNSQQTGQAPTYSRAVAQQFRQSGLDLTLLRISEQGLVKK